MKSEDNSKITKQDLYSLQKKVGTRDDAGRWKLKSLKPRHLAMAAMSAEGYKNKEISTRFGVSEHTVSRVLNDPLVKDYLENLYLGLEQEMRGMAFQMIQVVRELAESSDPDFKAKAVDKFEKLYKLFTPEGKEAGKGGGVNLHLHQHEENEDSARQDAVDKLAGMMEDLNKKMDGKVLTEIEGSAEEVQEAEWTETDGEEDDNQN